ncbi:hypothetical protein MRX96_036347 [Rhipicephalus microplus]
MALVSRSFHGQYNLFAFRRRVIDLVTLRNPRALNVGIVLVHSILRHASSEFRDLSSRVASHDDGSVYEEGAERTTQPLRFALIEGARECAIQEWLGRVGEPSFDLVCEA